MRSESPQAAGALEGDPSKIIVGRQSSRPALAAASTTYLLCGAPALMPNRRERRLGDVPWVMQHAVWCRTYGDGLRAGGPPRPNGGAAR